MKQTRLLMGMPISVEIADAAATAAVFKNVYDYFGYVDATYSTYKDDSEISRLNHGLPRDQWSQEMKLILDLCEQTQRQTNGYFNIEHNGQLDPSGLVKGWAIKNAADLVAAQGFHNFYIDAGGDVQVSGRGPNGQPWRVGIRNPFNREEIIKTVVVSNQGVATSGSYIRGQHIYNPYAPDKSIDDIVSITVIGPDIYNADRFATAAYAMGKNGAEFIENLEGYEAYMVDSDKIATLTSGFDRYVAAT